MLCGDPVAGAGAPLPKAPRRPPCPRPWARVHTHSCPAVCRSREEGAPLRPPEQLTEPRPQACCPSAQEPPSTSPPHSPMLPASCWGYVHVWSASPPPLDRRGDRGSGRWRDLPKVTRPAAESGPGLPTPFPALRTTQPALGPASVQGRQTPHCSRRPRGSRATATTCRHVRPRWGPGTPL